MFGTYLILAYAIVNFYVSYNLNILDSDLIYFYMLAPYNLVLKFHNLNFL